MPFQILSRPVSRDRYPMTDQALAEQTATSKARYLRVLSIAGSDSGGGAGIQADLKTVAALGCYGMTAITALTAQNTQGVRAIHAVPASHLAQEIDAVCEDIGVDAVKTGMLPSPEAVLTVVAAQQRHRWPHWVVDPVMIASSGARLMTTDTATLVVQALFPLATVVTPNLDEAEFLLGRAIPSAADLLPAAQALLALGARAVLLKGGHLAGNEVCDVLAVPGRPPLHLSSPRIHSANTHGTGCTLSAALACGLAAGLDLEEACRQARAYILGAIAAGAEVRTGQGHGPLNHGFAPQPTRLVG